MFATPSAAGIIFSGIILFSAPTILRCSHMIKPNLVTLFYLIMGGLLAYFSKSLSVFFFQMAIIFAQLVTFNSSEIKIIFLREFALHAEKAVLVTIFFLILYSSLPYKPYIMLGLLADRLYNYFVILFLGGRSAKNIWIIAARLQVTIWSACILEVVF